MKWIFKKYDGKSVDWIDLAQDMERICPVVKTVINLPVPYIKCLSLLASNERLTIVGVIQYVCRWHNQPGG